MVRKRGGSDLLRAMPSQYCDSFLYLESQPDAIFKCLSRLSILKMQKNSEACSVQQKQLAPAHLVGGGPSRKTMLQTSLMKRSILGTAAITRSILSTDDVSCDSSDASTWMHTSCTRTGASQASEGNFKVQKARRTASFFPA